MPVIEQKTTNKNKVDFDLNRLDKSKTTIFSKYPFKFVKNKPSVKGGTDLDDFDFEDYDEDEPEPDDADGDVSEDETEDEDA